MKIDNLDYLARQCEAAIAQGRRVEVALSSSLQADIEYFPPSAWGECRPARYLQESVVYAVDPAKVLAWCEGRAAYDAVHPARTARITRRHRKALGDLFGEADHD